MARNNCPYCDSAYTLCPGHPELNLPQPAEGDGASPTTVRFIDGGIVQMDRADYDKLTRPPAAAADAPTAEEWARAVEQKTFTPPHPDTIRLNWLEHMARNGGLMLMNGVDSERERRLAVGLALRPGRLDRTLREAIDQAAPEAWNVAALANQEQRHDALADGEAGSA